MREEKKEGVNEGERERDAKKRRKGWKKKDGDGKKCRAEGVREGEGRR